MRRRVSVYRTMPQAGLQRGVPSSRSHLHAAADMLPARTAVTMRLDVLTRRKIPVPTGTATPGRRRSPVKTDCERLQNP